LISAAQFFLAPADGSRIQEFTHFKHANKFLMIKNKIIFSFSCEPLDCPGAPAVQGGVLTVKIQTFPGAAGEFVSKVHLNPQNRGIINT
jgi:hypothetical protein